MARLSNQKVLQAASFFACTAVLWIHFDSFGASEFSGGRLTRALFSMADYGSLIFLGALLLTFLFPRVAATVALLATLLSLPFYLYILMPGPFRWLFKGEYSVPLQSPFMWSTWAVLETATLLFAAGLSIRAFFEPRAS